MRTTKTTKAELKKGQREEMEHTDDPSEALSIARDHVKKSKHYYEKLEIAEKNSLPHLRKLLRREDR